MKDKKTSGFSAQRIEEAARTRDVIARAGRAGNPAMAQSADRLGSPGLTSGKTTL